MKIYIVKSVTARLYALTLEIESRDEKEFKIVLVYTFISFMALLIPQIFLLLFKSWPRCFTTDTTGINVLFRYTLTFFILLEKIIKLHFVGLKFIENSTLKHSHILLILIKR